MLKEIKSARQIDGEPHRVWYSDPEMDVIVWTSDESEPIGFQIDYKTARGEEALTWDQDTGFNHYWIDDGENRPGRAKMTPILVDGGRADIPGLRRLFRQLSSELPKTLTSLIEQKLSELGDG